MKSPLMVWYDGGASAWTLYGSVLALRFFCGAKLERQHLARNLIATRRPRKMREMLNVKEVARMLMIRKHAIPCDL
jgi:hypothetical protein